jgi:hypothetical protein
MFFCVTWLCVQRFLLQVLVAVEDTVRVVDANEALPTPVFGGPILR